MFFAQDDLGFEPDEFSGRARLFPLPDLVMFPRVLQPLHIFEPRYREMFEDALAGDGLLAMAVLTPGKPDERGRPAIFDTACLGRVTRHQRLPDGRFHLLLLGVARVRVVEEIAGGRAFREARVKLCPDRFAAGEEDRAQLRGALLSRFGQLANQQGLLFDAEQLEKLCRQLSLAALADLMAHMLPLERSVKLQLLGEPVVERRCRLLLAASEGMAPERRQPRMKYPPDFSAN